MINNTKTKKMKQNNNACRLQCIDFSDNTWRYKYEAAYPTLCIPTIVPSVSQSTASTQQHTTYVAQHARNVLCMKSFCNNNNYYYNYSLTLQAEH